MNEIPGMYGGWPVFPKSSDDLSTEEKVILVLKHWTTSAQDFVANLQRAGYDIVKK